MLHVERLKKIFARLGCSRQGAAHRSQLLARMLSDLVEQETGYERARERSLHRLREGADLGTDGRIAWTRDSLHER